MVFVRRSMDSTSEPPSRAFFAERRICASALSRRKAGGTRPESARGLHAAELSIELLRIRLQPSEIRLGVGGVLDAMFAVEGARDVEIGADVLDDDVRRVAPAADGHVAVRQRETVERRGVRAANDLDAGARRVREPGRVDGVDAGQVGTHVRRRAALPLRRTVGELRPQGGSRAGVDAQRGRAFRKEAEEILGDTSSSVSASASVIVGGGSAGGRSRERPGTSGHAAVDASAARISRRLIRDSDTGAAPSDSVNRNLHRHHEDRRDGVS